MHVIVPKLKKSDMLKREAVAILAYYTLDRKYEM